MGHVEGVAALAWNLECYTAEGEVLLKVVKDPSATPFSWVIVTNLAQYSSTLADYVGHGWRILKNLIPHPAQSSSSSSSSRAPGHGVKPGTFEPSYKPRGEKIGLMKAWAYTGYQTQRY